MSSQPNCSAGPCGVCTWFMVGGARAIQESPEGAPKPCPQSCRGPRTSTSAGNCTSASGSPASGLLDDHEDPDPDIQLTQPRLALLMIDTHAQHARKAAPRELRPWRRAARRDFPDGSWRAGLLLCRTRKPHLTSESMCTAKTSKCPPWGSNPRPYG